ncbi:MAG: fibronectin type III domain-containing protein [Candidatus Taylorbacteria bacterium]
MKKTIFISLGVFLVTAFSIVSFTLTADKVMAAFDTNIFVPLPGNSVLIMSQQTYQTSGSVPVGRDSYNRDIKYATPLQICSTYMPVISGCVAYVKPTSCSAGNICTSSATYSLASGAVTTITLPPSVPTNLTVATTSATQARLTWTAAAQGTYPIAGYKIYGYSTHGYIQIGTSSTNSFVTTVAPGTTYRYYVKAYDNSAAQNLSAQYAGTVTLVVPSTQVSSIKITAPVSGETWASGSTHRISWTANVAPGTAPKFDIIQIPYPIPAGADVEDYQTGIGGWGRTGTYYDWQVSGMAGYSKYLLKMCISGTNVCDTTRVPFGVTFGVVQAPSVPTNLTVATTSATQARLTWTAAAQGTYPIAGYKIYGYSTHGYIQIGTSSTNSFVTTVAPGTTYRYYVKAYDNSAAQNLSAQYAGTVTLVVPAARVIVAPSVPVLSGVTWLSQFQIRLSWNASTAGTNPVAGYRIWNGDSLVGTSTTNSYTTTLAHGVTYNFKVSAYDNSTIPNQSQLSGVRVITSPY